MRALPSSARLSERGISFERLPSGDGLFTVNIMVDGQRIHRVVGRESDGTTRTQAEDFISKVRSDAKHDRLSLPRGRKVALGFRRAAEKYLVKLEDEDTQELFYTRLICRYYDLVGCRCTVYADRTRLVPTCLRLDAELIRQLTWMPRTCAYRRIAEGQGLADWHPLVSGSTKALYKAGISVRGKVISEEYVHPDDLVNYIDLMEASQD